MVDEEEMAQKLGIIFMIFSFILTIIFINAKINDKIDWSWLWILSPVWIPVGLGSIINIFKS